MSVRKFAPLVALTAAPGALALGTSGANPIRKVVNLLQGLREEVTVEGQRDKKMFDKQMCFCKNEDEKATQEIDDATQRISSLGATIKELQGSNEQLKSEIKELDEEIAEDSKSVEEATAVRKEEASGYSNEAAELKTNIGALDTAIPALKKGLSTSLLQTLRPSLMKAAQSAAASDREQIVSLLQGKSEAGSPDQILGILEQMRDNMKENLAKATREEEGAIETYQNLMDGKSAELKAATTEAGEKKGRVAAQVQKKADAEEDLEDTNETLEQTTEYLSNLKKSCKNKEAEFEQNERLRSEETEGINETIKILNDDDSLRSFDKTLSFAQVASTSALKRVVPSFVQTGASAKAQAGKFAKLKKMVTGMIDTLGEDQTEDTKHLEWCKGEVETVESDVKNVKNDVQSHTQKMEEIKNEAQTMLDEINLLDKEVKDLDKAVAEATAERKEQQAIFTQTLSELNIASSLLQKAAERMNQVYAAKQEGAAEGAASTEGETAAMLGLSFVQVGEVASDPYAKKTGKGLGIVAMLEKLRQEISLETQEKERDEQEQQKDYEQYIGDSAASKDTKRKDITNKSAARGRLEEVLNVVKKHKKGSLEEQTVLLAKQDSIHQNCDFIMENHDARQTARTNEIEGLKKSLAVLNGANYGLAQTAPVKQATAFLERRLAGSGQVYQPFQLSYN